MTALPIVEHGKAQPSAADLRRVERLAASLRGERPELSVRSSFRDQMLDEPQGNGPSLHLDDLSELALIGRHWDVSFLQDRARLRAGDGDFVAYPGEGHAQGSTGGR